MSMPRSWSQATQHWICLDGIVAAAVLDRVGERLAQSELDLELAAGGAAHLGHDRHDLPTTARSR